MRTRCPLWRRPSTASRMSAWWGLVPTTSASCSMALPGTLARSTMVRTRDVGRLSTTYQPWSSRSAAALVRPAPDRPVIITMSAMRPAYRGVLPGGRTSQACLWRRSSSRRGMLAASGYSGARARKPAGGGGSSMWTTTRPWAASALTYRLERPVDEGDEDVLLHLLDRLVLHQVGADAPVLLGRIEHLVVDPAAARRLQERVVEEEQERRRPAGAPWPPRRSPRRPTGCARTRGRRRRRRSEPSAKGSAAASARA